MFHDSEATLAAAAVERARLVALAEEAIDSAEGFMRDEFRARLAAASPHADLAAVRAVMRAAWQHHDSERVCKDVGASPPDCCAFGNALSALPNWCREQP